MKNHAHVKAEINGNRFSVDVEGDGESLVILLAGIMKQLNERGYDAVVRKAMIEFFNDLPE